MEDENYTVGGERVKSVEHSILEKAKRIKMVLMDVDGTLTDGKIYILPSGEEIKAYDTKDGAAIVVAQVLGIKVGIITGKSSQNVVERAKRLKIDDVYIGAIDKLPVLKEIMEKYNLKRDEICYIGDDIGDFSVMKEVGFAVAVGDAHYKVKEIADYITEKNGGNGAVREAFDVIFEAQNLYDRVLNIFEDVKNWKKGLVDNFKKKR